MLESSPDLIEARSASRPCRKPVKHLPAQDPGAAEADAGIAGFVRQLARFFDSRAVLRVDWISGSQVRLTPHRPDGTALAAQVASADGSNPRWPVADAAFDTVFNLASLNGVNDAALPGWLKELYRLTGKNLWIALEASPGRDRAWWGARFLEAGFRKHPLSQRIISSEAIENEGSIITLLFEKVSADALEHCPPVTVKAEQDLHIDMVREPVHAAVTTDMSEVWSRAQEAEYAYQVRRPSGQADQFAQATEELFQHFHLDPEACAGRLVIDLGAGSRLRSKYFRGARIAVVEPLASKFIAGIPGCDLSDASHVYPHPAEDYLPTLGGQADLVLCVNVLDRTYHPKAILANAKQYLKRDGLLVLSVDLCDHTDEAHPIAFSQDGLNRLIREAGFEVLRQYQGLPTAAAHDRGVAFTAVLRPMARGQKAAAKIIWLLCSGSNHVKLMAPVARQLRSRGWHPRFISLDAYYGQGSARALQELNVDWLEVSTVTPSRNWHERDDEQRRSWNGEAARAARAMFEANAPKAIVVGNDTGVLEQIFLRAAERCGVRTVLLQEGVRPSPTCETEAGERGTVMGEGGCELICTWGSGLAGRLRASGVGGAVEAVGNPLFDLPLPPRSSRAPGPETILLIGQCFGKYGQLLLEREQAMYEGLIRAIVQRGRYRLVFKLHPQQDPKFYAELQHRLGMSFEFLARGESLESIQSADLVVSVASTMTLEAFRLGVPALTLHHLAPFAVPELERLPGGCRSEVEFNEYLDHPESWKRLRSVCDADETLVRELLYHLDGKACERIGAAIENLVSVRPAPVEAPAVSVLLTIGGPQSDPIPAVRSVLRPGGPDREVVVIDSTADGAPGRNIETCVQDPRLRILHVPGANGTALKQGILACRGEIVARLPENGVALPGWCERLCATLQANPAAAFAVSGRVVSGEWGHFEKWQRLLTRDANHGSPEASRPTAFACRREAAAAVLAAQPDLTEHENSDARLAEGLERLGDVLVPAALYAIPTGIPESKPLPKRTLTTSIIPNPAVNEMTPTQLNNQTGPGWAILKELYATKKAPDLSGNVHDLGLAGVPLETGTVLYNLVREHRPQQTLETGFAYGFSTLFILQALAENGTGKHEAIDPVETSRWNGIGLANVRRAGFDALFTHLEMPSFLALPSHIVNGFPVDFAFIDGSHLFDDVLLDAYYLDRLLAPNGILVFDDWDWMPAVRAAVNYIENNLSYAVIPTPQAPKIRVLQKIQKPARTWDHFVPFEVLSLGELKQRKAGSTPVPEGDPGGPKPLPVEPTANPPATTPETPARPQSSGSAIRVLPMTREEIRPLLEKRMKDDEHQCFRNHSRVAVNRKCLCMAVPKNGCTTIKLALHQLEGGVPPPKEKHESVHTLGKSLSGFATDEIVDILTSRDWFRFGFVRNPYHRLFSTYKSKIYLGPQSYLWLHDKIREAFDYPMQDGKRTGIVAFRDFVRYLETAPDWIRHDGHLNLQTNILMLDMVHYDFIGRFENFPADFTSVLNRIQAPAEILGWATQITNSTRRIQQTPAYDRELADCVYRMYEPDFVTFGYERDSWTFDPQTVPPPAPGSAKVAPDRASEKTDRENQPALAEPIVPALPPAEECADRLTVEAGKP